jgi:pyridoxine/pyridoxamine 5'-phosphate oxidase
MLNHNDDPFIKFDTWLKDVCSHKTMSYEEANAVCITTCVDNKPSSRMVSLKKYDRNGFYFFTSSVSRKGRELAANPNAAMLFYWPCVNRQIRIEGQVKMMSDEYAEISWKMRPLDIRIGPSISVQSPMIPSRKVTFLSVKVYILV